MNKKSGAFENFLKNKQLIEAAFAAAIAEQLSAMGQDIKGVSWFSSSAHDYCDARLQRAA